MTEQQIQELTAQLYVRPLQWTQAPDAVSHLRMTGIGQVALPQDNAAALDAPKPPATAYEITWNYAHCRWRAVRLTGGRHELELDDAANLDAVAQRCSLNWHQIQSEDVISHWQDDIRNEPRRAAAYRQANQELEEWLDAWRAANDSQGDR